MRLRELTEAPVIQGGVNATQTQLPVSTNTGMAVATAQQNTAEIQRNKQLQRKQIQDQINLLTKQLEGLRGQLASIH